MVTMELASVCPVPKDSTQMCRWGSVEGAVNAEMVFWPPTNTVPAEVVANRRDVSDVSMSRASVPSELTRDCVP